MYEQIVFAGFGGQGIMFAGQLLAYAAMDQGYQVTWIPSYGPEMRGGTAYCYVVISDSPIGSPVVNNPGLAFVFNKPSFAKFEPKVARDGLLVTNSSLIDEKSTRAEINQLRVPATSLASEFGTIQMTNMVMIGAALAARPILPLNAVKEALKGHLPSHRRDTLDKNFLLLDLGASLVQPAVNAAGS